MKLTEKITDILFPPSLYCISCGNIIDKTRPYGLCDECMEKLRWPDGRACARCGKILNRGYLHELCSDCRELIRYFDKGYTCLRYSTYERRIISDFKYNGKAYYSVHLGKLMADRMSFENEKPDIVTAVPITSAREKKRGYNQSELLGKCFAENTEGARYMRLLKKTRETLPMRGLSRMDRLNNVEGVFSVIPELSEYMKGRSVCVVDDVFTTGSTLSECSRVLKENGAGRVIVLTVAAGANITAFQSENSDNKDEISSDLEYTEMY